MHPKSSGERLRIGLLLDSLIQPRWVAKMLGQVTDLPLDLSLVIINENADSSDSSAGRFERWKRVWANNDFLLYALYKRFERRFYELPLDPFVPTDITPLTEGLPVLRVRPRQTRFCDYFSDEEVDEILQYDLDVALRLGFRIIKGRVLEIARYGVWSYHHGDNREYRGGPAGFWEVMEGNSVSGAVLQILTENLDAGKIIYRSFCRTDRLSVRTNRSNYYWKAAAAVPRKLRDLHEQGPEGLDADTSDQTYDPYSKRLYTKPTNREMVRFIGRMGTRRIKNHIEGIRSSPQWFLAYRFHGRRDSESTVPLTSFYNFTHVIPPRDRFWADPFPIRREGEHFIFLEEYLYSRGRGHISVMQIRRDGTRSKPSPVLEQPYHLAYPFLFEWKGELFMIPETVENRQIEMYRCIDFPDKWKLESVVMKDVEAVDATVVQINGRWWMFTNVAQEGAVDWDDELALFHASDPLGPWTPHRKNPVKTDVRSSRPAGGIFRMNGELYRPAQDCSESYGHSISINRILQIDASNYEESCVSKILPNWAPGLVGTHTINAASGLTVIDGRRRRKKFRWKG